MAVKHYSTGTGTYTLNVQFVAPKDDYGNNCSAAKVTSVNSSIIGNIETGGDVDYFSFNVPSAGTLTAYTTGSTDTYGILKNSGCADVTGGSNNDNGTDKNFRISQPVTAGTYFVAVRHNSSGTGAYTLRVDFVQSGGYNGNWNIPYLAQLDYGKNMGESACGPTSVAMLLRFYYPNSGIDMPEVYHSGTQTYRYNSGPADIYRNVSFACPSSTHCDSGLSIIDAAYRSFYSGSFSGMSLPDMENYLKNIWGVQTTRLSSIDDVYREIQNGPLLGHVYGLGNSSYGHYIVIRGIDQNGTPNNRSDDYIIVNDPYQWNQNFNGNGYRISYNDFFVRSPNGSPWFREADKLSPVDTEAQRQYTVVVDTGNNGFGGNSYVNSFSLDAPSAKNIDGTPVWKFYYGGGGDWYYPTVKDRAARWTPRLQRSGNYQVSVKFKADSQGGQVTYSVYNASNQQLATVTVNQYSSSPTWSYPIISNSVYLANGCYVKASNIPANSNIDAVKFKYLGQ